jgi:hypothetical protein
MRPGVRRSAHGPIGDQKPIAVLLIVKLPYSHCILRTDRTLPGERPMFNALSAAIGRRAPAVCRPGPGAHCRRA